MRIKSVLVSLVVLGLAITLMSCAPVTAAPTEAHWQVVGTPSNLQNLSVPQIRSLLGVSPLEGVTKTNGRIAIVRGNEYFTMDCLVIAEQLANCKGFTYQFPASWQVTFEDGAVYQVTFFGVNGFYVMKK